MDLAALENGGDVVDCSDAFYASARNLLMPGRARTTGEGWENARRRGGGNDHVTVRLAGPGQCGAGWSWTPRASSATRPRQVLVRGCVARARRRPPPDGWVELLPRTGVQPDTRHVLAVDPAAAPGSTTCGSTSTPTAGWPGSGCSASCESLNFRDGAPGGVDKSGGGDGHPA